MASESEKNLVNDVNQISNVPSELINDDPVSGGDKQVLVPPPLAGTSSDVVNDDEPAGTSSDVVNDDENCGHNHDKMLPPPAGTSLDVVNDGDNCGHNDDKMLPPPPVVSNLNPSANEWMPIDYSHIPAKERAVFMTFSRGYHVTKKEVETYFVRKFGLNCIQSVYIDRPRRVEDQPKFGNVVFTSPYFPPTVLKENGGDGEKARHYIQGRAVWFKTFRGELPP